MTYKKPVHGGAHFLPESIARAKKDPKKYSEHQTKLKLLSTCSGVLFALGTFWLIDPKSIAQFIEVGTIGVAGGVANYAINGIAITRGAYQAASGVTGAAAASVGAILITGVTISMLSFVGLTINSVDQMVMQEFGRENTQYVDGYIAGVRQSDEVVVAVEAAFNQVTASAECERESSCVSRRGRGGEGKTYFTLNGVATQTGSVHQGLLEGETLRDGALEALEKADGEIQTALNAAAGSRKVRRARVQKLLSEQRTALSDLERAFPLSVVTGLAETLQAGVSIPNDRDLTQKINGRLAPAGKGIAKALSSLEITELESPDMPPETGVTGALEWVGFFLPLFMMLVLIDTVFPVLLWFFAYSSFFQLVEPKEDDDDDDPFSMSGVLDAPPVRLGPATGARLGGPRPKGHSSQ